VFETLKLEREGEVAWLTLNRPERLNAMSRRLVAELRELFSSLRRSPDARFAAGRAFCAGLDLKESASSEEDVESGVPGGLRAQRRISELVLMMRRAPQPIIACVHGAASGGGFALALGADVRIAGESARMNAAFIRIGLSACDVGVSYFLPRMVGASSRRSCCSGPLRTPLAPGPPGVSGGHDASSGPDGAPWRLAVSARRALAEYLETSMRGASSK
jgi:enoyl-CoA hydratase